MTKEELNEKIKEYQEKMTKFIDSCTNCSKTQLISLLEREMNLNTQLRQENNILRKNVEHNDKVVDKARWNEMIYKSRCEKAIEHIKEHQLIYTSQYEEESNFDNHLLDILNGGDEE